MTRARMTVAVTLAILLPAGSIHAADHTDGTPSQLNQPDPSSDITDVFAWMSDATHLTLIMDVFPGATPAEDASMPVSQFSNAVKYVFHTSSKMTLLGMPTPVNIICTF